MRSKNKRKYPRRVVNRVISVLVVIAISGIVGEQTGLGFDGMMMMFGAILVLFGSYAEGGSPTERDRLSHIDEQIVMFSARQNQPDHIEKRPNALFSLMAIGIFLFVLGIVVGLASITFPVVMTVMTVLAIVGLVYAYRKQIFYRDALGKSSTSQQDNQNVAIQNLANTEASDTGAEFVEDDTLSASQSSK